MGTEFQDSEETFKEKQQHCPEKECGNGKIHARHLLGHFYRNSKLLPLRGGPRA